MELRSFACPALVLALASLAGCGGAESTVTGTVTLDGQPAPDIETTINKLNQTGPIGKLITIRLLPEYLGLLADGELAIAVDDADSNIGDGFAFDFARLLINPKGFTYAGTIKGIVVDKDSNQPIDGALVSAANVQKATTGADGKFEMKEVPAGLVVTTGSHPDYVTGSEQKDLEAGQVVEIRLPLQRVKDDLAERLENEGKVDLYGIYFDTDKATLKPESEGTLNQVLGLLNAKPALRIAIAGHTDSQASDSYNLDLSRRRAQAVTKWLTDKGVAASRLEAQGFGEAQPVADNDSATHYDLGVAYKEMGLLPDAVGEFETAARDASRECMCFAMIGMIYLEQNQLDRAAEAYVRALSAAQKTVEQEMSLYYDLGNVYEMKGKNQDALYYFQKIARRDPGYRDVSDRIQNLSPAPAPAPHANQRAANDDEFDRVFDDLFESK